MTNQNTQIEGQTIQCSKETGQRTNNDLQSTTQKTKDRATIKFVRIDVVLCDIVLVLFLFVGVTNLCLISILVYHINSPFSIFANITCIHESRSGRLCSCQKPNACIISWIAVPIFKHGFINDTSCSPPCRPILE